MDALGLAYVGFARKNADFFLLMFTLAPMQYPQQYAEKMHMSIDSLSQEHLTTDDAFMTLYRGVERCIAEGIFQPKPGFDALEMAQAFWSMAHGIAMLQLTILQPMSVTEETNRMMFRAIFEGIRRA